MAVQPAPLVYVCGQTQVDRGRRELRVGGVTVELGERAFDVLEVLIQSAGNIVSKSAFMDAIWAGIAVEENTLQVHISVIRKALGQDRTLLKTVSGRGYRLLGTWTGREAFDSAPTPTPTPTAPLSRSIAYRQTQSAPLHNLPARLGRTIGRDAATRAIAARLQTQRLVSVTGTGGIGKTTVAIAVGERLLDAFDGKVHFIELTPRIDPSAIASALGLSPNTEDPISAIIALVRDRRMLLILDGCEHVIETAASIAERLYWEAPLIHILTTTREPLRIEGEHLHHLLPLRIPPRHACLTATEAMAFPAVQLLVERAITGDRTFTLGDSDAPVVAAMCRTLDGLPLAIEIAAGRIGALGVQETSRLLDAHAHLLWQGRRSAPPRHRTLTAALDWSHDLLSAEERIVFRRLSIFTGDIVGLEPPLAVAGLNQASVVNAIDGLVAKTLMEADTSGPVTRYRLLNTTRAYAAAKLSTSADLACVSRRFTNHVRDIQSGTGSKPPPEQAGPAIEATQPADDRKPAFRGLPMRTKDPRGGHGIAAADPDQSRLCAG